MGKYFGTDGFRGEANVTLTAAHAYKVGKFLGWYYGQEAKKRGERARIVIGKDTRRSSYMFEYALASGITASGSDAYLLHVTTTPSVAYIAKCDNFDCGIMISASHNPYYDNGLKIINSAGEKMDDSLIAQIEDYLDGIRGEVPYATRENIGRTVDYIAGRHRYVGYLISLCRHSFKGKKVALDCANGSACAIARSVFEALGAKTYVINCEPDGTNINKDAGSTHIEGLCKYVIDNGMDVGFAYDGDADRCLCVDEKGQVVDGDKIMYIYAKYLKEQGKLTNNTVVATVMSNCGLFKALDEEGIEYAKTAVGDKNVNDYMSAHNNCIGGEQSGHIIFRRHASTGDGILTSLKMMEVMLEKKETLSKLAEPVVIYPQVLKNVRVKDKSAVMNAQFVLEAIKKAESIIEGNGRMLVRESGTEPLVRVMAEAEDIEMCNKCIKIVIDAIAACGLLLK
ncbi:MAG: phosphoglucosamine mutase [Ruminococcaceae bacterium]|nr:phosphoglucosamine mutase [Oscillospiraceae bacterium]